MISYIKLQSFIEAHAKKSVPSSFFVNSHNKQERRELISTHISEMLSFGQDQGRIKLQKQKEKEERKLILLHRVQIKQIEETISLFKISGT